MNDILRRLIEATVTNDTKSAKKLAGQIIDGDTSRANMYFCKRMKNLLQATSMNMMELPANVQGILHMEDVSQSFIPGRYYLTEREDQAAKQVTSMYNAALKLAELAIPYLNSLMLYGESGTGKTYFGRYLAHKLGLPFVYMNFANCIDSYLGSTSKNILKAFEFVEKQKCVFMLDEVDAIGMKRGREDVGEMGRIVISLMQSLDRIRNDVIIVGATNRIDMIDDALLRRFTIKHEVKKFTSEENYEMITQFLSDVQIGYEDTDILDYLDGTQKSPANIINETIQAIAESIASGSNFALQKRAADNV
ncbi:MAG: AAA family ATPase [Oscillospiraceae bacterium]